MNNAKGGKPKKDAKGLRPWQYGFWDALIGKCPGANAEEATKLTPELLWDLAVAYFQGEAEDTMIKKDFIRSGEQAGKVIEMTTIRPFSWVSLDLFLLYHNVRSSIFDIRINRNDRYPEFREVIERIEHVIYEQKYDGAAIGAYNPQLVIRDLGLADKVDASVKTEQPLFTDTPQPPVEEGMD